MRITDQGKFGIGHLDSRVRIDNFAGQYYGIVLRWNGTLLKADYILEQKL